MSLFLDDAPPNMKRRLREIAAAEEDSSDDDDSESESEEEERPVQRRRMAGGAALPVKQAGRRAAVVSSSGTPSVGPKAASKRGSTTAVESAATRRQVAVSEPAADETDSEEEAQAPRQRPSACKPGKAGLAQARSAKRTEVHRSRRGAKLLSKGMPRGTLQRLTRQPDASHLLHGPKAPLRRRRASASGLHGAEMRALRLRLRSRRS